MAGQARLFQDGAIMGGIMKPPARRALLLAALGALALLPPRAGRAWAGHGMPFGVVDLSSRRTEVLAAVLVLAAGVAIVVIVILLTKKTPPSE